MHRAVFRFLVVTSACRLREPRIQTLRRPSKDDKMGEDNKPTSVQKNTFASKVLKEFAKMLLQRFSEDMNKLKKKV